jgi:dihydroorotate dehydrogenase
MINQLYLKVLKPILFQFEPDLVHDVFVKIGIAGGKIKPLNALIKKLYGTPTGKRTITVDGITYQGPALLSAGFDYNAHLSPVLFSMGFAGEEVGSVTARPCQGNPPPRLKRLLKSKSIQVYKGLKNDGVDVIIKRIKSQKNPEKFVQGISIAKTNDEKNCEEAQGIEDYCYSLKRLTEENIGHFYTINISCPNAFGGEDFAKVDPLKRLLSAIKQIPTEKPIYIKMPINLAWEEFNKLLQVIDEHKINGVVIGNLNKNYNDLDAKEEIPQNIRGGLSGLPCRELSNKLIQLTREHYPQMTIMGCGGVFSAADALEKMKLGANLVQLISGMIFIGPHLMNEINEGFYQSTTIKPRIISTEKTL